MKVAAGENTGSKCLSLGLLLAKATMVVVDLQDNGGGEGGGGGALHSSSPRCLCSVLDELTLIYAHLWVIVNHDLVTKLYQEM